jgi:hypothetical protein
MTAAELAERLHARRTGAGWVGRCPAHRDLTPSLSVREGRDGRVLLHCWAGCDTAAVLAAAGIKWRDVCGDSRPRTAGALLAMRRAAAERRRAEECHWLRCLLRAVGVVASRHPGHPDLAAVAADVERDLRARGAA